MFNIRHVVYPDQIAKRIAKLSQRRSLLGSNALATAANFSCGSFVRFSLSIDTQRQVVTAANFSSNGCGFMLAAADALAERIVNRCLIDLHGLADGDLYEGVSECLGDIPAGRRECVAACIESMRSAFADLRTKRIEEFRGEKPLICTCFGVSEETIETLLSDPAATEPPTVEKITRLTNAGGGCGSCRMLIQEMIDCMENGNEDNDRT